MNLGQVVQHRHQLPLAVNFDFSSEAEASQADIFPQVAKDRLDDPQTSTVDVTAEDGVDLFSHTHERIVFCFGQHLQQDIDLTGIFLLGAAQALGA